VGGQEAILNALSFDETQMIEGKGGHVGGKESPLDTISGDGSEGDPYDVRRLPPPSLSLTPPPPGHHLR